MATFDITITYPDPAQARVLAALKSHYTVDGVEPTNAQAINAFRASCRQSLKHIVKNVESDTRVKNALDSVEEVDVT